MVLARAARQARSTTMDIPIPPESSGPHVLPDAEIERLELLALASAALIAHAQELEDLERRAQQERRAA
jgi:hypothetical protein